MRSPPEIVTAVSEAVDLIQQTGRSLTAIVRGMSMSPTLRDGDRVVIETTEIKIGDIVAYRVVPHDAIYIHRVIAHSSVGYWIQGDNQTVRSRVGPIDAEQILGKASIGERCGNRFRLNRRCWNAFLMWQFPRIWASLVAIRRRVLRRTLSS